MKTWVRLGLDKGFPDFRFDDTIRFDSAKNQNMIERSININHRQNEKTKPKTKNNINVIKTYTPGQI